MPACPKCKMALKNSAELAGKTVSCPRCQAMFPMPPLAEPAATWQSSAPPLGDHSTSASASLRKRKQTRNSRLSNNAYQLVLMLVAMGFSWFMFAKYIAPALKARSEQASLQQGEPALSKPHRGATQNLPPQVETQGLDDRTPATELPANGRANFQTVRSREPGASSTQVTRNLPNDLLPSGTAEPRSADPASRSAIPGATSVHSQIPEEATESVTIDLSRRFTPVDLEMDPNKKNVEIKLIGLEECNATFRFQPEEGIVARGKPVDVLFPEYPLVRIRLEVVKQKLRLTPQLDVGGKKPVDFTEGRVDKLVKALTREANDLIRNRTAMNQQLASAMSVVNTRGGVDLPKRNAAKNAAGQLRVALTTLEQQLLVAQQQSEILEALHQLRTEIHDRAYLVYIVRESATEAGSDSRK